MAFNLPTVTTNDISYGNAVLFIGPTGATPSVDVGTLSEDGYSIELTATKRMVKAGNPKLTVLTFTQEQSAKLKVSSIEWDQTNIAYALGSGVTSTGGGADTMGFGGEPAVYQVALRTRHAMAQTGHTLFVDFWKAQSGGDVTLPFTQDEHKFDYTFEAIYSTTNWGGATLGNTQNLIKITRQTT